MSVQAMSWVLEHSRSEGKTRCVLISIANHVGPDGEGWVYVDQVLKEARCTEDTYHRAVRWAIDNGELSRQLNKGGSLKAAGNRRPNSFRLHLTPAESDPQENSTPSSADPCTRKMHTPEAVRPPKDAYPEPLKQLEPSKEPSISLAVPASKVGTDDDPDFVAFWNAYPRKVGKGQARDRWRAAVKLAPAAAIVAAAGTYSASRSGKDSTFTAHPATWLKGERWLDEPPPADVPEGWNAIESWLRSTG